MGTAQQQQGQSSKKSEAWKSTRFAESVSAAPPNDAANDCVEITLDVQDGSMVALQSEKRVAGDETPLARARNASARIKQVAQELRRLASRSAVAQPPGGLRFVNRTNKDDIKRRFDELAKDGPLHRSKFGMCIGMEPMPNEDTKGLPKKDAGPTFAEQLFDVLAWRRQMSGDSISKEELIDFWDEISDTSFESRLYLFFDMMDRNADGMITLEEVKEIIILSASENMLSKVKEQAEQYAQLVMDDLDPNNLGYIELHNLKTLMLHTVATNNRKLSLQRHKEETDPLRRARFFLEDNWKRVWVMLLWLSICAGLFSWKFAQYRQRRAVFDVMGYCVCVAKGAAETLKLNMALILLPVCRNTITWIRDRTVVARVVPFDDNLNFHKVISAGIAVGAGLHVISHLTCDFPRVLQATDAEYAPLAHYFGTPRPGNYWWFVKGTEGWTGLVMLVLMAVAFVLATPWFRRGRLRLPGPLNRLTGFKAFWYSHHLFVIVYALLIVHGNFLYLTKTWYKKSTWMYLAVPMVMYASERLTRALRSRVRPVDILKVSYPTDNVLSLHFSKPHESFRYKSGQYILVNCADVSPLQWRPFSITSAPQDDYVSVHIKIGRDWTKKLKNVMAKVCPPLIEGRSGPVREVYDRNGSAMSNMSLLPKVRIDGPYGAPAQDYKQYNVVLLVGSRIGATPMISIIKDIINNMKQLDGDLESGCAAGDASVHASFRTRRAYFYWVTREQEDFEWFRGVMDEVAEMDKKGVVEIHNHCTSVYEEGDARSAVITMLQWLKQTKHGVDIVSGTRVKTYFARPNWDKVYEDVASNHPNERVGVFYCGVPGLSKKLHECARHFSRTTRTEFEFHKENF